MLLSAAATVGAGLLWLKLAPRHTPAGQPGLVHLDAAGLQGFRETFNAAAGRPRVVALLSPT